MTAALGPEPRASSEAVGGTGAGCPSISSCFATPGLRALHPRGLRAVPSPLPIPLGPCYLHCEAQMSSSLEAPL